MTDRIKGNYNVPKTYFDLQRENLKQKQEILLLSKAQRKNIDDYSVASYLLKVYDFSVYKYPNELRVKIIDEVKMIFSEFSNFDNKSDIQNLRELREEMSFGIESGMSDEYYRNMILGNKISERIKILQLFIINIYGPKTNCGRSEVNEIDYLAFKEKNRNLNSKYGVNILNEEELDKKGMDGFDSNFKKIFSDEFKKQISKDNKNYSLIKYDLTRLPQVIGNKGFENLRNVKLNNGQTVNLEEIYIEYLDNYTDFKNKTKIFHFGNMQNKESMSGLGLKNKKYGIGYEEVKNAYKKEFSEVDFDKMSTADLIITLNSLIPIVGGVYIFKQAQAGINADGSLQSDTEKLIGYVGGPTLAILSVLGVGIGVKLIIGSEKYIRVLNVIGNILNKLSNSTGFAKLAQNQKFIKLLESIKGFVPQAGNILNKLVNPMMQRVQAIVEKFNNGGIKALTNIDIKFIKEMFTFRNKTFLDKCVASLNYIGIIYLGYSGIQTFKNYQNRPFIEKLLKNNPNALDKIVDVLIMANELNDFVEHLNNYQSKYGNISDEVLNQYIKDKKITNDSLIDLFKKLIKRSNDSTDLYKKHNGDGKAIFEAKTGKKAQDEVLLKIINGVLIFNVSKRDYINGGNTIESGGTYNYGLDCIFFLGNKKNSDLSLLDLSWRIRTYKHELQHALDYYINGFDGMEVNKTEIVARINDRRTYEQTILELTIYDNYLELKKTNPSEYNKKRKVYLDGVKKYSQIAFKVKDLYGPDIAALMLSFTPVEKWEGLLK